MKWSSGYHSQLTISQCGMLHASGIYDNTQLSSTWLLFFLLNAARFRQEAPRANLSRYSPLEHI
jgi:hypothetical protein